MKTYLFKGKRIKARSKDEVLRRAGLNTANRSNRLLVTKLKKA